MPTPTRGPTLFGIPIGWLAVAAVSVALPWICIFGLLVIVGGKPMLRASVLLVVGIGLYAALLVARGLWIRRRRQFVLATLAVAKTCDGQRCPYCGGTPAVIPSAPSCCRKAPNHWTAEQYRAWWDDVAGGQINFAASFEFPRDEGSTPGWRAWQPGWMTLAWFMLALLFEGLQLNATDALSWLIVLLPRTLVGYGMDVGFRSFTTTSQRVCAKCGYPRVGDRLSERCPECGNAWLHRSGTRRTRGPLRRRPLVAGCVITFLGFALMLQLGMSGAGWIRHLQPTSGLLRAATVGGVSSILLRNAAWNELSTRTLSPQQDSELFGRVLDLRQIEPMLLGPPAAWMQAQVAAGKVAPALLDRFRHESFVPVLKAPSTARVGEPVRIEIHGDHLEPFLPPANGVAVCLTGAWFEGDAPAFSTTAACAWTLDIAQKTDVPSIEVRSDRAGKREIVVRVWLVARPFGTMRQPLALGADGTPVLPPDALWAVPVDVRHRITISP